MISAFQPFVPLPRRETRLRTHRKAGISPRRPRLTADTPTPPSAPTSAPPPIPQKPHPLSPPSHVSDTPFFNTLYTIFRGDATPDTLLKACPKLTWHTPLFDLTNQEIGRTLTSFLEFAIAPTISITSVNSSTNTFAWTLSFTYPLPWRPRVTIAAESTTDSLQQPTEITDTWFVHPVSLVRQALPRLVDIIWLYPGPHAETDTGIRRVLSKSGVYTIERFAGAAEVRVSGSVKDFERVLMFAAPTLPAEAFEGGLRRREKYWAVAPVSLREIGEDVEWAVRVPGGFCGSAENLLPVPNGEGVRIVNVEERIVVVERFGGVAMREVVEKKVEEVLRWLGGQGVEVGRGRIWVRSYESKVGFNDKGLLAIAMYGSSKGVPRRNEIVVDVTGLVDEEFWKR